MKQHYFIKPGIKLFSTKPEKAVCGTIVKRPLNKLTIKSHKIYTKKPICKHCIKYAEGMKL